MPILRETTTIHRLDVAESRGMVFLIAPGQDGPSQAAAALRASRTRSTKAIHLGYRETVKNLLQFVFKDFEFVGSL